MLDNNSCVSFVSWHHTWQNYLNSILHLMYFFLQAQISNSCDWQSTTNGWWVLEVAELKCVCVCVCFYIWSKSILKLCTLLLQAAPIATPPLCQLAWTVNLLALGSWSHLRTHTFTHSYTPTHTLTHSLTHSHTHTHNLQSKFQTVRAKTVAAKEWDIFVDQPTDIMNNQPIELLVTAKNNTINRDLGNYVA